MLIQAIKSAGFEPGQDVWLGLDVAAASLKPTYTPTVEAYVDLLEDFPLYYLEDPFHEDDWAHWQELKDRMAALGTMTQPRLLVGDDLFVGNRTRLQAGIERYVANAILVKICQAPTLGEILETIRLALKTNYVSIISHRSGDTLDAFISDLAVGTASAFVKAGAPNDSAPERVIKYERLVQIEEELGAQS